MKITITLDTETAETLSTLANHCGVTTEHLATTFIKDSSLSYMTEQNELRDSLIEP